MKRRFPIGIQDFVKLREENFLYVDKTEQIHTLVSEAAGPVFLSRPRRFGKSLLCATLGAFFEGKRELFTGLAIDALERDWKKYPVIRIDLNPGDYNQGLGELTATINRLLESTARKYKVQAEGETVSDKFARLIEVLHETCGERVVVIIDEYDKPLLSTIDDRDIHEKMRNALKGFYGVLKSADEHLRFVFLTGVTRFSKVSIFSDLNNLTDISMDPLYCDICGVTQEELERDFSPELEGIAQSKGITQPEYLAKLKHFYNGYRFSESLVTVYNPFGLLYHFNSRGKFEAFWFATGTPTFLIKLIQAQKINVFNLERKTVLSADFRRFDVDNMEAVPVLYQSGYLTIVDYDEKRSRYTLDYPNEEVRSSFAESLCDHWTGVRSTERTSLINTMLDAVEAGDVDAFVEALKPFYNSIPYELVTQVEYYYELVFYLVLRMLGLYCLVEVHTAIGRIDAVLECDEYVYVLEFKVNGTANEALQQIDDKDYALSWNGCGKKVFKTGIVFDKEKRNIGGWETAREA